MPLDNSGVWYNKFFGIYICRGDAAFCSIECREEQMKQDERNDKSKIKPENHHNHSEFHSAKSDTSSNNDTIAAAWRRSYGKWKRIGVLVKF